MSKRILLINNSSTFMVNTFEKNFREYGFDMQSVPASVNGVNSRRRSSDIILLYAWESIASASNLLTHIRDICTNDNKPLCIIGYPEEIEAIREIIPRHLISCEFERPFDMNDLVENVKMLASIDDERQQEKHILLVDDDLMFLKLMQDWLSIKYNVTIVKSGMQAITYIANHIPDLILLDYDMPVTSGPQVMEMIRSEERSANIPIIFLTGKSDRESVMSVMKLKPQGYMLKSSGRDEIIATVDHFFLTKEWKISNGEL